MVTWPDGPAQLHPKPYLPGPSRVVVELFLLSRSQLLSYETQTRLEEGLISEDTVRILSPLGTPPTMAIHGKF